jgi:hypothetical protein
LAGFQEAAARPRAPLSTFIRHSQGRRRGGNPSFFLPSFTQLLACALTVIPKGRSVAARRSHGECRLPDRGPTVRIDPLQTLAIQVKSYGDDG